MAILPYFKLNRIIKNFFLNEKNTTNNGLDNHSY